MWKHPDWKEVKLSLFADDMIASTVGASRFAAVSMQNDLFLCYYLLIGVLFYMQTTVNLILPHPVDREL